MQLFALFGIYSLFFSVLKLKCGLNTRDLVHYITFTDAMLRYATESWLYALHRACVSAVAYARFHATLLSNPRYTSFVICLLL